MGWGTNIWDIGFFVFFLSSTHTMALKGWEGYMQVIHEAKSSRTEVSIAGKAKEAQRTNGTWVFWTER
jgi:hypothetical protein